MLLFPLRTFAVAGSLTILTSSLALLTAASKVDGRYPYNTATVRRMAPLHIHFGTLPRRSPCFLKPSSLCLPATCCTNSSEMQNKATSTHPASRAPPEACSSSSSPRCFIGYTTTCSFGHSNTLIHQPTWYTWQHHCVSSNIKKLTRRCWATSRLPPRPCCSE